MRGWFKLIETIRKTEPPSISTNDSFKSPTNSDNTPNGYIFKSPETTHIDSPQSKSPNLISSSPIHSFDDLPPPSPKPPPTTTSNSKRRSTRHKKITIRKSSKSKESLTTNSTFDDNEILLNDQQRKRLSIDSSISIPLATDLQSLPGHNQDELRDQRFLDYSDINTLSNHLNRCLSIDKKSCSSSLNKQHFFKTRHNILNKIFKLSYLKTFKNYSKNHEENLFSNEKNSSKTIQQSTTLNTFKTDWSVNRRNSSSYRHEPKNVFHILQLNPKKNLSLSINNHNSSTTIAEFSYENQYEQMKNILIRTYYPHFHRAFQYGFHFGIKSKIPIKHHDIPIKKPTESITDIDQSMTITLKSPPSIFQHESKKRGRRPKEKPLPITSTERRVSEEIPPVEILTPIQILSSPPPLIVEKEINNNRKRKISITLDTKKRRSIPSPEIIHDNQSMNRYLLQKLIILNFEINMFFDILVMKIYHLINYQSKILSKMVYDQIIIELQ